MTALIVVSDEAIVTMFLSMILKILTNHRLCFVPFHTTTFVALSLFAEKSISIFKGNLSLCFCKLIYQGVTQ
jgi:hypothetical protein